MLYIFDFPAAKMQVKAIGSLQRRAGNPRVLCQVVELNLLGNLDGILHHNTKPLIVDVSSRPDDGVNFILSHQSGEVVELLNFTLLVLFIRPKEGLEYIEILLILIVSVSCNGNMVRVNVLIDPLVELNLFGVVARLNFDVKVIFAKLLNTPVHKLFCQVTGAAENHLREHTTKTSRSCDQVTLCVLHQVLNVTEQSRDTPFATLDRGTIPCGTGEPNQSIIPNLIFGNEDEVVISFLLVIVAPILLNEINFVADCENERVLVFLQLLLEPVDVDSLAEVIVVSNSQTNHSQLLGPLH